MSSVVLGLPRFTLHNPNIDCITASLTNWSIFCHSHSLRFAISPSVPTVLIQKPGDLTLDPSDFHDLDQVFRKDLAVTLCPNRPFDCSIDFLTAPPLTAAFIIRQILKENQWKNI